MRARLLDKFYTTPETAQLCVYTLMATHPNPTWDLAVEPSAGNGAFLPFMPCPHKAYDIAPEAPGITKRNFFTWKGSKKKLLILGNPPFGKNAHLAIKFFNHGAQWAQTIAFIVPKSFLKVSIQNRLSMDFSLLGSYPLPPHPFTFNQLPYTVPCVFQIWERQPRTPTLLPLSHPDFSFTTPQEADFAIQRVGIKAGVLKPIIPVPSKNSHYYIKSHIDVNTLYTRFQCLDVDRVKHHTAGNPSIAKRELVALYEDSVSNNH